MISRRFSWLVITSLCAAGVFSACTRPKTEPKKQEEPVPEEGTLFCRDAGLKYRAFSAAAGGIKRGDLAADFTVELVDGTSWKLSELWTGCETYVFVPDTIPVSAIDATSIWKKDLGNLILLSPRNVHYFFVSRSPTAAAITTATTDLQTLVDRTTGAMEPADADHWRAHLHVVKAGAGALDGWLKTVLTNGIGAGGFAIDRFQHLRGVGQLADVTRSDAQLQSMGQWPWKANLAYAAYEAKYLNSESDAQERLAPGATVVQLWSGETLAEFAETEVQLPTAEQMSGYDTLEVEIVQRCPDATIPEFGNCGAWDYLAHLFVKDGDQNVELARFITSYHRETHWVVDISPMLGHLKAGGKRTFRWDFAPSWNTQPTATNLSLRFSNRAKGFASSEIKPLWMGAPRAFNAAYNDGLETFSEAIPADAKKVEVYVIITGHGGDANNCAEFCNHQHTLTVNGTEFHKDHPEASTNKGCIGQVENGMTPNQGGTWWFGRGGWCPGQQVNPWVVDITELAKPGTTATLKYAGSFQGMTPPDNAGNIHLTSYLVISR